jgi:hypothetical protein
MIERQKRLSARDKDGDIDGVWMPPVIADVMTTLLLDCPFCSSCHGWGR